MKASGQLSLLEASRPGQSRRVLTVKFCALCTRSDLCDFRETIGRGARKQKILRKRHGQLSVRGSPAYGGQGRDHQNTQLGVQAAMDAATDTCLNDNRNESH